MIGWQQDPKTGAMNPIYEGMPYKDIYGGEHTPPVTKPQPEFQQPGGAAAFGVPPGGSPPLAGQTGPGSPGWTQPPENSFGQGPSPIARGPSPQLLRQAEEQGWTPAQLKYQVEQEARSNSGGAMSGTWSDSSGVSWRQQPDGSWTGTGGGQYTGADGKQAVGTSQHVSAADFNARVARTQYEQNKFTNGQAYDWQKGQPGYSAISGGQPQPQPSPQGQSPSGGMPPQGNPLQFYGQPPPFNGQPPSGGAPGGIQQPQAGQLQFGGAPPRDATVDAAQSQLNAASDAEMQRVTGFSDFNQALQAGWEYMSPGGWVNTGGQTHPPQPPPEFTADQLKAIASSGVVQPKATTVSGTVTMGGGIGDDVTFTQQPDGSWVNSKNGSSISDADMQLFAASNPRMFAAEPGGRTLDTGPTDIGSFGFADSQQPKVIVGYQQNPTTGQMDPIYEGSTYTDIYGQTHTAGAAAPTGSTGYSGAAAGPIYAPTDIGGGSTYTGQPLGSGTGGSTGSQQQGGSGLPPQPIEVSSGGGQTNSSGATSTSTLNPNPTTSYAQTHYPSSTGVSASGGDYWNEPSFQQLVKLIQGDITEGKLPGTYGKALGEQMYSDPNLKSLTNIPSTTWNALYSGMTQPAAAVNMGRTQAGPAIQDINASNALQGYNAESAQGLFDRAQQQRYGNQAQQGLEQTLTNQLTKGVQGQSLYNQFYDPQKAQLAFERERALQEEKQRLAARGLGQSDIADRNIGDVNERFARLNMTAQSDALSKATELQQKYATLASSELSGQRGYGLDVTKGAASSLEDAAKRRLDALMQQQQTTTQQGGQQIDIQKLRQQAWNETIADQLQRDLASEKARQFGIENKKDYASLASGMSLGTMGEFTKRGGAAYDAGTDQFNVQEARRQALQAAYAMATTRGGATAASGGTNINTNTGSATTSTTARYTNQSIPPPGKRVVTSSTPNATSQLDAAYWTGSMWINPMTGQPY